ncbi:TPA: protein mxiK [Escherichia coli]|uniref:protein mxiK n=1 Tax=Escherichia coli TaxID=562 RepID=UPI000E1DE8A9|nr:protein mxiK [Escherichia coli]RDQ03935.1 Oxygen-regulated invasion protein OrgA [Escherichia coli]RDQ54383.1 Oxygen-regulated invasion protein OrgA [Escherichia coli]
MQKIDGIYEKYLSIIFDPASYINTSRIKLPNGFLDNNVIRREVNNLIIDEYDLDCSIENLNGVAVMFINNWNLLPVVAYYIGVESINHPSFSKKDVVLDFIKNMNDTNSEIINNGFNQMIAWGGGIPQGLFERIKLLFNPVLLKENDTAVERNILQLNNGIQYARKYFTCVNS